MRVAQLPVRLANYYIPPTLVVDVVFVVHFSGSRLEDLLEKSHVAHSFGSVSSKRRRTNLDAVLAGLSPEEEASATAAAAATTEAT